MRILIAEDEPISRRMLEKSLSQAGYEVLACSDGAQAWEKLSGEDPPEIAVVDWMMPKMDGLEVCRRVRRSADPASIYIILLTARGNREDIIAGLNAGADDYMTKPFDREELCARVRVGERLTQMQKRWLEQETTHYVAELEQARSEVQRSRIRIVAVQEQVRKQIAHELHGPVQSKLIPFHVDEAA